MTPQEWLQQELQKPLYAGWAVESIYSYLNAPQVTETKNPEPQEMVPVVLSVAEIIPLIQSSEWRAIRSSETAWTTVSDAAMEAGETIGDIAIVRSAMAVDQSLLDAFGPEAITLLQAVVSVLNGGDAILAQALITTLVAAGKLSRASADALQAAMMQPDPDWEAMLYSVEPSIWQAATGRSEFVTQQEIQEAMA